MNQEKKTTVKDFTDLVVWQVAHELVLLVYKHTQQFPKTEIFGLSSQIQRSVVSITSNIAEGFARRTKKEKLQFYYISLGSVSELSNQVIISKDLKYISESEFYILQEKIVHVRRMLNGLVKSSIEYT